MIGKTLAHYEITELLGEGGMGAVYRARDTKLDRDVALKLLPASLVQDPERVARFEREARTLASIQHAHIASIYGFEHDEAHGNPLRLFTAPQAAADLLANLNPSTDLLTALGNRFLLNCAVDAEASQRVEIVLNWNAELERD